MFEPDDGRTATEPEEPQEGSQLQRFLTQLGMPASSAPIEPDSLGLPSGVRMPRYYGAVPEPLPPDDSTAYSTSASGGATDRVKFMLQRASDPAQPSESPVNNAYSHNSSSGMGSLFSRSSFARPDASDNSYRPDVSTYLAPALNRLFRGNSASVPSSSGTPIGQPTLSSLPGNKISASAATGGSGPETNRFTAPTTVSPDANPLPQFPQGTQVHELVSNLDTHNLLQPDTIENRTTGDSNSPQAAKSTARETAPKAEAGKQMPGKAVNAGKPAASNGSQQPDSFPVVNPAETWKNSDKQYSIPQLKSTVGGTGAKNDPADVKLVQHLLNAAIISQELPGMKTLPEDGKMSNETLKTIHEYDRTHGLLPFPGATPQQLVIEPGKGTITKMGMNRLVDPRWNIYDDTVKQDVEYYNKRLRQIYQGSSFDDLDWRLVKAMLWTEVQGPTHPEWWTRPMQIGNPGDRNGGIKTILKGGEGTLEYVSPKLTSGLRESELGRMNVRAAIPYLITRAIQHKQEISNDIHLETFTKKDGTPGNFAKRVGTTVKDLYDQNPGLAARANSLPPGTELKYRPVKESLSWRKWEDAAKLYNNHIADYKDRVLRNYEMIKQIWPR